LVPSELVIDWVSLDLSGIGIAKSVYRIDAGTGVTGAVGVDGDGRTPQRPLWEQIHRQIELLSTTESQRLATKVLEEVSEVDENTLLPLSFLHQLREEVGRVSHYQWGNLPTGGRRPLVPPQVNATSDYEFDDERTLDSGWTSLHECKRRWFTGFARSAQKYARFDSEPEFYTAKTLDSDPRVDWWYRNDPAVLVIASPDSPQGHRPDFVVGIGQRVWILEIKGEQLLADFNSRLGLRESVLNWCTKQSTELGKDIRYRVVPGSKIAVEMVTILDGRDA
jgi:hypothetical protein